jgi:hypothetical protein
MLHLGAKADFIPSRPTRKTLRCKTPLAVALKSLPLEVATVIMDHDPSTINQSNPNEGWPAPTETALGMAIATGNKNAVSALLARPELDAVLPNKYSGNSFPYIGIAMSHSNPQFEEIADMLLDDSRFMIGSSILNKISSSKFSLRLIRKCLSAGKIHVAKMGG